MNSRMEWLLMAAAVSDPGWQAHWERGETARDSDDPARALSHYQAALLAPDQADISAGMRAAIALAIAESLMEQGDFAAAERELADAIILLPAERPRLQAMRSAVREAGRAVQRDWQAGMRWLRRSPAQPWGYSYLARALHAGNAWPTARSRLQAELGSDPSEPLMLALFQAGFDSGKPAPVLAAMRSFVQARPSLSLDPAWLNALVEHGEPAEAVQTLARAVAEAGDDQARRQHYRQWLRVLQSDPAAALEVHRALLPIGEHADHLRHAQALVNLGRGEEALVAYAGIMRRWPDDPPRDPRSRAGIGQNAYWGYLRLHLERGSAEGLIDHLRQVVRPADCRIPSLLAVAADYSGLPGLAAQLRAEASAMGCSDPDGVH